MKKVINFFKAKIQNFINVVKAIVAVITGRAQQAVAGTAAEAYIDTAVKIIIVVVLGALLIAFLYAMFNENVLPTIQERIEELFNYAG